MPWTVTPDLLRLGPAQTVERQLLPAAAAVLWAAGLPAASTGSPAATEAQSPTWQSKEDCCMPQ
jgi:hypothetical protein